MGRKHPEESRLLVTPSSSTTANNGTLTSRFRSLLEDCGLFPSSVDKNWKWKTGSTTWNTITSTGSSLFRFPAIKSQRHQQELDRILESVRIYKESEEVVLQESTTTNEAVSSSLTIEQQSSIPVTHVPGMAFHFKHLFRNARHSIHPLEASIRTPSSSPKQHQQPIVASSDLENIMDRVRDNTSSRPSVIDNTSILRLNTGRLFHDFTQDCSRRMMGRRHPIMLPQTLLQDPLLRDNNITGSPSNNATTGDFFSSGNSRLMNLSLQQDHFDFGNVISAPPPASPPPVADHLFAETTRRMMDSSLLMLPDITKINKISIPEERSSVNLKIPSGSDYLHLSQ